MFKHTLLSLVLVFSANAQDGNNANIRLLAFSRSGEDMEVLVTDAAGKALIEKPLALPTEQLSPDKSVPVGPLVFRTSKDLGKDPSQMAAKVLGKVVLPGGGDYILVFLPLPPEADTFYRISAMPMPRKSFGSGDYAFLNYCGSKIGCVIDGSKLEVAHGKSGIYQSAKSSKGAGNRTIVCYQQDSNGKWEDRPFFSSRIIIQDGVRNLVLICRSPINKEIDFRGVADFCDP